VSVGIWFFLAFLIYAVVLITLPVIAAVLGVRWSRFHPAPRPGELYTLSCKRCQYQYSSAEAACPQCGLARPVISDNLDVQSWRSRKLKLLGIATVWPFVYMVLFFGVILSMIALTASGDFPFWIMACVFPLHFFTILLTFGLLVVYIMLVVNSVEFDSSQRTMWIVALFLGGWIAQLVAFVVFVWRPWIAAHPRPATVQPSPPAPPHDPVPPVG